MNIDKLLAAMEKMQASDLFVTTGKPPAMRIKGEVRRLDVKATSMEEVEAFMKKTLRQRQLELYDENGDLDLGYSLGGQRYRLNFHRQQGQHGIVARALPMGTLSFEELRLPESVAKLADKPRGLVLVTGSTGSGKSTTLAAIVHRINSMRNCHVVTIEDPIEFVHKDIKSRITQREVGSDTVDFNAALRHVVRESPDVILIGEIRDMETMNVAMSAALTGHLVLATLHTINTAQSLQRIIGLYPSALRSQACLDLSLCLQGIVSQRLLPRKDGNGRIPAVEVLTATPAVSRLVREQRIEELTDLMKGNDDPDLQTFGEALLALHKADLIEFEVGLHNASNPDEFRLAVQGMETGVDAFRNPAALQNVSSFDMKTLLHLCIKHGASDLHLSVDRPPIFRILGSLHRLPTKPLTNSDLRSLLFSILTNRQRTTFELEKELDFSLSIDSGVRFRVNAYYQKGAMAVALRTIPSRIPTPQELRLPEVVFHLADRPHGLLLVVGPTGSGKTTTLACLLDRINQTRSCHILTVEDPIEYNHISAKASVDQREVNADTKSFANALKYVLRQDPDVILVGEMRDLETISAALTAAETGHLVMATLHTNDASQTMDRIIDVFPPHQQHQVRAMLSSSLLAVVSQRLLPRADGSGRVAGFEVLLGTPAVRNIVREGKTHQLVNIMETSMRDGMTTMDRAVNKLYRDGQVTYETALRYVLNPAILGQAPR